MELFAVYCVLVTVSIIFAGIVLMLIDHYLEMRRLDRAAGYVEYFIPRVCEQTQKMSMDTIKSINDELYKQIAKYEDEDDED